MIKEAIGVGETEVAAQEDACRQLGVETYEAEFEIIQRAEKKILGLFGGCPAKVRAFIKSSPADVAQDFLKNVLDAMGVEGVTLNATESEENGVVIDLEGEDVGSVIGRRGETLDALQYLTGLVANHVENSYYKVTINTGDYREKREKTLEILGRKLAFKAVKTGYKTSLEPMNPYERRIIHTAVQKVSGATSWSEDRIEETEAAKADTTDVPDVTTIIIPLQIMHPSVHLSTKAKVPHFTAESTSNKRRKCSPILNRAA